MNEPLRHSIVFTAKRRMASPAPVVPLDLREGQVQVHKEPTDLRLFWMTDGQAQLFEQTIAGLLRSNGRLTREQATETVERFVIRLLAGQLPKEDAPTSFHRLRLAFPILKHEQIQACPRSGCPARWVDALVLTMMDAHARKAVVLFQMTPSQSLAFNDAIGELMATNRISRDQAWGALNNLVAMLITSGAPPKNTEPFVLAMAEHFPRIELNEETIAAGTGPVRRATEDDVREYSFTLVPPGDGHAQF